MHDFAHRTELLSHPLSKPLGVPYSVSTAPTLRTLIATATLGGLLAFGGISPALAEGASGQTIGLT
ncbi:MAG TPA: hypothetical protein ENO09_06890, partial [bacterium]|nr:hypothetical protein [bacterium]